YRTLIFVAASIAAFVALPWVTPRFFSPLWWAALGAGGQGPAALPGRGRGACRLGRQRGGAARIRAGHGARRDSRQGSCAGAAPAHGHLRIAHAVLLYSRRLGRIRGGADRRAGRVPASARREDGDEILRRIPAHARVRL